MREDKLEIDSANGLVTFCKTMNSPIKMNKKCATIILANYDSRDITLSTDKEGYLYQTGITGEEIQTTLDDMIDEVCEWNYEDIEDAKNALKRADDYIAKCKLSSQIEKLEKEARALNYIFYQTKYGRNVEMLADRIAKDVMQQLNLVPIYDVPFYEDKVSDVRVTDRVETDIFKVSHQDNDIVSSVDESEISDDTDKMTIVASDPVKVTESEPEIDKEYSKGAR